MQQTEKWQKKIPLVPDRRHRRRRLRKYLALYYVSASGINWNPMYCDNLNRSIIYQSSIQNMSVARMNWSIALLTSPACRQVWFILCSPRIVPEGLTHWGRDKMAAISQTTLSNPFSWMKIFEFRLKFHWSLFLRFQLIIIQHWFRKWLGADQATYMRHSASMS